MESAGTVLGFVVEFGRNIVIVIFILTKIDG
jgi:hypothetical protein